MNDTLKRAFRTFLQGFIGILALIAVPTLNGIIKAATGGGDIDIDPNIWRTILIAAMAGGFVALIAFVQNWLEQKGAIPTVAK
jgi:hypothetical protein